MPLLKVGGRGAAGHTVTLRIRKTPWWVENSMYGYSCGVEDSEGDNTCWNWNRPALKSMWWTPVEPGYDAGVMQGHYISSEQVASRLCQYDHGLYPGSTSVS